MRKFIYLAAVGALFLTVGCNHENDRPMTPANGTTLSTDPTAPSVDPSVTDTSNKETNATGADSTPAPNTDATNPNGSAPGAPGSGSAPGAPGSGTNGAPVGGLR